MNFGAIFRGIDAAIALGDVVRRFRGDPVPTQQPPDSALTPSAQVPGSALAGQLEARLTNVVVAALKEAFDRDHARLELERAQLDEQRRRAEEAMRLELRRQASDRELNRLRLLAGGALVGWIASVALLVGRLATATPISRAIAAVSWLLLLGALGSAFTAQGRVGASLADGPLADSGTPGALALWLLIAGLALTAISLLF